MPGKRRKYPDGTTRTSLFMPPALKAAVAARAEKDGVYETDVIHAAVRAYIGDEAQEQAFG